MSSVDPSWSAATPGQPTLSGQVNQFLAVHTAKFGYRGIVVDTDLTPTYSSWTLFSSFQSVALKFQVTNQTTLTRVIPVLKCIGLGVDLVMTLQGSDGFGNPSGTPLASTYIPAEWTQYFSNNSGTSTTDSNTGGFILAPSSDLTVATDYFIVLSVAPGAVAIKDIADVGMVKAATMTNRTGYIQNTSGTWASQAAPYAVFFRTNVGMVTAGQYNLSAVSEDNGLLLKSYDYSSTTDKMSAVREWAKRSSSVPLNLLDRADASPVNQTNTSTTTINGTGMTGASTTLTVASTTGFPTADSYVTVQTSGGTLIFYYTSAATSTTFTGCSLLSGLSGQAIATGSAVGQSTGTWGATNCSVYLAQPSTSLYGTYSFALKASGTPSSMYVNSTDIAFSAYHYIPVTAGTSYTAVATTMPATTVRKANVSITWYTSTTSSTTAGTASTQTAGTGTQVTVNGTAPTGALYAQVTVTISTASGNLASNEVHYVDKVGLFAGSNSQWSYPGLGISTTRSLAYVSSNGSLSTLT